MNISLEGKAAVVTGAGRGIGRAIAEKLGEAGASILLVDVDELGSKKPGPLSRVRAPRLRLFPVI
jgi:NAD(P)-dependent dehydrogenase (short-subunit alcohol dehydrogenase family)